MTKTTWNIFRHTLILIFSMAVLFSCKKNTSITPIIDTDLSGGEFGTSYDFSENAFGREFKGLSGSTLDNFAIGNSFFRNNWVTAPASTTVRDGLGAVFNSLSCGGCHPKDGRAAPPINTGDPLNGLLFRLSVPGTNPHGSPNPEPIYGNQLNNRAILGVKPEGNVHITYATLNGVYPDGTTYTLRNPNYTFTNLNYGDLAAGTQISPRIANQVMGLGLLEAIPTYELAKWIDELDANKDGISGKANMVWDEKSKSTVMGRFGWKANQPNLLQQTAAAFAGDIGITSSLFPNSNFTDAQKNMYPGVPNDEFPEISNQSLQNVVEYLTYLAVPANRNIKNLDVVAGKRIFKAIGCENCHRESFTTKSNISVLNNQQIKPYTDLLLHNLGEGLADNRADFLAAGNEWRTPPLWGIGLIKKVNGHTFLLHDGRARNIEEAILWHQGEAENSTLAFKKLPKADRSKLIAFIESI